MENQNPNILLEPGFDSLNKRKILNSLNQRRLVEKGFTSASKPSTRAKLTKQRQKQAPKSAYANSKSNNGIFIQRFNSKDQLSRENPYENLSFCHSSLKIGTRNKNSKNNWVSPQFNLQDFCITPANRKIRNYITRFGQKSNVSISATSGSISTSTITPTERSRYNYRMKELEKRKFYRDHLAMRKSKIGKGLEQNPNAWATFTPSTRILNCHDNNMKRGAHFNHKTAFTPSFLKVPTKRNPKITALLEEISKSKLKEIKKNNAFKEGPKSEENAQCINSLSDTKLMESVPDIRTRKCVLSESPLCPVSPMVVRERVSNFKQEKSILSETSPYPVSSIEPIDYVPVAQSKMCIASELLFCPSISNMKIMESAPHLETRRSIPSESLLRSMFLPSLVLIGVFLYSVLICALLTTSLLHSQNQHFDIRANSLRYTYSNLTLSGGSQQITRVNNSDKRLVFVKGRMSVSRSKTPIAIQFQIPTFHLQYALLERRKDNIMAFPTHAEEKITANSVISGILERNNKNRPHVEKQQAEMEKSDNIFNQSWPSQQSVPHVIASAISTLCDTKCSLKETIDFAIEEKTWLIPALEKSEGIFDMSLSSQQSAVPQELVTPPISTLNDTKSSKETFVFTNEEKTQLIPKLNRKSRSNVFGHLGYLRMFIVALFSFLIFALFYYQVKKLVNRTQEDAYFESRIDQEQLDGFLAEEDEYYRGCIYASENEVGKESSSDNEAYGDSSPTGDSMTGLYHCLEISQLQGTPMVKVRSVRRSRRLSRKIDSPLDMVIDSSSIVM